MNGNRCLEIAAKCKNLKQLVRLKRVVEADNKGSVDERIRISIMLFGYQMCMIDNGIGWKK